MKMIFAFLLGLALLWPSAAQAAHWQGPVEHGVCKPIATLEAWLEKDKKQRRLGFMTATRTTWTSGATDALTVRGVETIWRLDLWGRQIKHRFTWALFIPPHYCILPCLGCSLRGGGGDIWPPEGWVEIPWRE